MRVLYAIEEKSARERFGDSTFFLGGFIVRRGLERVAFHRAIGTSLGIG